MMRYQRNIMPQLIFLILANHLTFAIAQPSCFDNGGNYTSNSTYQTNLNTALSTLSTGIKASGFYSISGEFHNSVHAFALCLGDLQLDTCKSCLQDATANILQSCPNNRQAHIWNDLCMLRYSNDAPILGIPDYGLLAWYNVRNATQLETETEQFKSDVSTLLDELRYQASYGSSFRKVAAGNISTSSDFYPRIFGMMQCTPDLSQTDCDSCLRTTAEYLPSFCDRAIGARINLRSCFLRYDVTKFYNQTRLQELAFVRPLGRETVITILISIFVPTAVGVIILFLIFHSTMKLKQKSKEQTENDEMVDEISIVESLQYDFNVIKAATDDFSEANKLGKGGFGTVYKGILSNGQEIAAKRLSNGSSQGDLEFKNEVMLLAKLQHKNLVRLLGFSLKRPEKLLVYEFVQNASLDHFIFDHTKRSHLDWGRRYKIIGGIARGIHYLHEDSRLKIIHRDLKASNILLDGEMNPKIADFGMARLFVPDESQGITNRIVGTYGYMAPEYVTRGQFSVKSDVFSFGVILIEIISGQKNNYPQHAEMDIEKDLISRVWKNWHKGTVEDLVDPVLCLSSYTPPEILRCIHIGLLCVQENATDRPTMVSVVRMLSSFSISLSVPSTPAFYMYNGNISKSSFFREFNSRRGSFNRSTKNEHAKSRDPTSQNEISISDEFHAR